MNPFLFLLWIYESSVFIRALKNCVNCKHYIPPLKNGDYNGKCKLFRITSVEREEDKCSLDIIGTIYHSCTLARLLTSKCGEEGRFYVERGAHNSEILSKKS